MKKEEKRMRVVSDYSMMDGLTNEEFNSMLNHVRGNGSGSGSGSECGSGCGCDIHQGYVQAGSTSFSRDNYNGHGLKYNVYLTWEAGIIPTPKLTVWGDAEIQNGKIHKICVVVDLEARWIGYYGITIAGRIEFDDKQVGTILEGYTIPDNLRGWPEE